MDLQMKRITLSKMDFINPSLLHEIVELEEHELHTVYVYKINNEETFD